MKFDFVIGNPPYQEDMEGTSDKPIYNFFMDEAFKLGTSVELIHPARFLFNAGKTSKAWNQKMLQDEYFRVLYYEPDSNNIFPNLSTPIKGGVAITYRDAKNKVGAIETFTSFPELNTILARVKPRIVKSLADYVYSPESYKFTKLLYKEHPEIRDMTFVFKGKTVPLISKGHDYDLTSNIFDKLYGVVFFENKPEDGQEYIQILGRKDNKRERYYVKKSYIAQHDNLDSFKLYFPKSNGSGIFGEPLSDAEIGRPGEGHTQTFLSIGKFETIDEVKGLMKYVRTKFLRTMLGILKVTQDNKKTVWKYVPLQDFTPNSDIDWSKSIPEIDRQLYAKYGLSQEEIDFIESHVKEMS